jgi:hypothetical protein
MKSLVVPSAAVQVPNNSTKLFVPVKQDRSDDALVINDSMPDRHGILGM